MGTPKTGPIKLKAKQEAPQKRRRIKSLDKELEPGRSQVVKKLAIVPPIPTTDSLEEANPSSPFNKLMG